MAFKLARDSAMALPNSTINQIYQRKLRQTNENSDLDPQIPVILDMPMQTQPSQAPKRGDDDDLIRV